MIEWAVARRTIMLAGMMASLGVLAACDDPKPGLQDEKRVEKVVDCKAAVGHFAPTEAKKDQLCECVTGKLATQGLSLADLTGPRRDRAMEQLHWCGMQVGIFGKSKPKATAESVVEAPEEIPVEGEPTSYSVETPAE